jgi:putative membrane protein
MVLQDQQINKDLVLREKLAIERTVMANQRTFLSFLRTSLYFFIAGLSISEFMKLENESIIVVVFVALAFLLFITGIVTFYIQKKKIARSRLHIGNYKIELDE